VDNVASRPRHDQRYDVDATALEALGWAERVDFEAGLRDAIATR